MMAWTEQIVMINGVHHAVDERVADHVTQLRARIAELEAAIKFVLQERADHGFHET